jgi:hypothetical protein
VTHIIQEPVDLKSSRCFIFLFSHNLLQQITIAASQREENVKERGIEFIIDICHEEEVKL